MNLGRAGYEPAALPTELWALYSKRVLNYPLLRHMSSINNNLHCVFINVIYGISFARNKQAVKKQALA